MGCCSSSSWSWVFSQVLAKLVWENGLSDGNSIRRQSKSQYLLQQMQDQNSPLCRSVRKGLGRDVSLGGEHDESVLDWTFHELDRHGGSLYPEMHLQVTDAKVLANVGNYENYNVLMI
ncbi:hypothetical protein LOK49_LG07G01546 [Camellia lanceoleosa]|uniref:Uncharacterized protein n=1 Tax=Camellia lanceoleosa TaxID=1840588 RepID=A0ACC0H5E6_9ERIC|nr:hypothetical protein LOK49_LG07G01546 [Camellia lanceoleosa]